jgi:hydroxymethylglutaryl-CoA reductase (NADPH)
MPISHKRVISKGSGKNQGGEPPETDGFKRNPMGNTPAQLEARLSLLRSLGADLPEKLLAIADPVSVEQMEVFSRNIESYIGTAKVPVGIAGPVRVHGSQARGDFYLPLATTEAALVASYNRGALLISEAGGCNVSILAEGVSRSPMFSFKDLPAALEFTRWVDDQFARLQEVALGTTRHGKLVDMKITVEGNHVYLNLEYTVGDASGQNMVTIASQAICEYVRKESPITPLGSYVEANLSGDKKASFLSFQNVRGKHVTADVTIPAELVRRRLRTTPRDMQDFGRAAAIGGAFSGTIGVQGHYANALAAIFIACGQDVACVSEASVGITRFEVTNDGDLYATVSLPNLIVGTVGGGTCTPTAQAGLGILGMIGAGKANAFAEVCAAACLAGELSITGALCADEFTRAHKMLARIRAREGRKKS